MKSPFPYMGAKSAVSRDIWARFGNPKVYSEPFAGSLAVLLARQGTPGVEIANDYNCYIANFFRSIRDEPEKVADLCDSGVNEADLHARHKWLVNRAEFRERMLDDPFYYDPMIAAFWAYGQSAWIGGEWCHQKYWGDDRLPETTTHRITRQPPRLTGSNGVHSQSINPVRITQKAPSIAHSGHGVHRVSLAGESNLIHYFKQLSERLRRVKVCCGDWSRVISDCATWKNGVAGIVLDPPYSLESGRDMSLYATDNGTVAHDVRKWCLANGDNKLLRIAYCSYDDEEKYFPPEWEVFAWKTQGGYGNQGDGVGRANKTRERIFFSPHCLKAGEQLSVFGNLSM